MSDGNYNDAARAERAFHDGKRQLQEALNTSGGQETDKVKDLRERMGELRARYLRYVR